MLPVFVITLLVALFGTIAFADYLPAMIGMVVFLAIIRFLSLRLSGNNGFIRQFVSIYIEIGVYVFVCARDEISLGAYARLPVDPEVFSINAHFIIAATLMLTCLVSPQKQKQELLLDLKNSTFWAAFLYILYVAVLIPSWCFNLAIMGEMDVGLPFKITGILTVLRLGIPSFAFVVLIPLLFHKRFLFFILTSAYFLTVTADAFVRKSKGTFIAFIVPMIVYVAFFQSGRVFVRVMIITIAVLVSVEMYSLIGWYRKADLSAVDLISNVSVLEERSGGDDFAKLLKPLTRVNLSPIHLSEFYNFESKRWSGDFDKIAQFSTAAEYNTRVIDSYGSLDRTSSGASGLAGWYLYFGVGGVVFAGFLIVILSWIGDCSRFLKQVPQLRIFALILFMGMMLMNDSADFFLRPSLLNYTSIAFLLVVLIFPRHLFGWLYRKRSSGL